MNTVEYCIELKEGVNKQQQQFLADMSAKSSDKF